MKSYYIILLALLCHATAFAQITKPSASATIEVNNLNLKLRNGGDLFSDSTHAGISIKRPTDTAYKSVLFNGALWMGGMDANNRLHLSTMSYRQNGFDYYPGPISKDSVVATSEYNKIWSVTEDEIKAHRASSGNNAAIVSWPTNGNTSKNETPFLAPFIDINNNQTYNPSQGDFPKINGNKMSYMVYNDKGVHEDSKSLPLEVEVQNIVFAYDLPGVLSNTALFQFKIQNKSANTYTDFYTGFYSDFDLGFYADDFMGCDPARNLYFVYNGLDNDQGATGFGNNPPAAGIVFLNKSMDVFRTSVNNMEPINGNPFGSQKMYQYLKGKNYDSTDILDNKSKPTTKMYHGDVQDATQWSMESAKLSPTNDRRGIGAIGPITFRPNEEICVDMAFIVATGTNRIDAVKKLQQAADSIQLMYDRKMIGTNTLLCAPNFVSVKTQTKENVTVFPNPAKDKIAFKLEDKHSFNLIIYNAQGQVVFEENSFINNSTIDISTYSEGIYYAVLSDGAITYKEKFFKIK